MVSVNHGAHGVAMKTILTAMILGMTTVQTAEPLPSGMPHPNLQDVAGQPAAGWLGMWHGQTPQRDEYAYKYSGGLGTYCAKHRSQAIYVPDQQRTFFVVGGTVPGSEQRDLTTQANEHQARITRFGSNQLQYLIGCFDHARGLVSRPVIVYDKWCGDAHDNPVMTIAPDGHIWVLGPSHGSYTTESFVSQSRAPYDHTAFEHHHVPLFAYPQPWWTNHGFAYFHSRYSKHQRGLWFTLGTDPLSPAREVHIAHIERGSYQISAHHDGRLGTIFNMHPRRGGLEARRNLYYLQTDDGGATWTTANGTAVDLPLREEQNPALFLDTREQGKRVYLKDLVYDSDGHPCALYLTSQHNLSGPRGGERVWWFARFNGTQWDHHQITTSDNNYDMGELARVEDGTWRLLAPTTPGPQLWNTGGEMTLFVGSADGSAWQRQRQVTSNSPHNHSYARRPLDAHDQFAWIWADGHARSISVSHFYFSDIDGNAYQLPARMSSEWALPIPLDQLRSSAPATPLSPSP